MRRSFGEAAGVMALVTTMTLGFGGGAEAVSAPASVRASARSSQAAAIPLQGTPYRTTQVINIGVMYVWQCPVYGQLYVAYGYARGYRCLPLTWLYSYLVVYR